MQIIESKIDWMEHWDNFPHLKIVVDKMLPNDRFIYRRHSYAPPESQQPWSHPCDYWTECDGWVKFFHHSPSNEEGYGGREFRGELEDGSHFSIRGPWSSNAMEMNRWFPPCHEVSINEREGKFPSLWYHGYALRADLFVNELRKLGENVAVINSYGVNGQIAEPEASSLINSCFSEPFVSLGQRVSFAIVKRGMSLVDSQKAKRVRT